MSPKINCWTNIITSRRTSWLDFNSILEFPVQVTSQHISRGGGSSDNNASEALHKAMNFSVCGGQIAEGGQWVFMLCKEAGKKGCISKGEEV